MRIPTLTTRQRSTIRKRGRALSLLATGLLLSGCGTDALYTAGAAAGTGALGNMLGKGNPLVTAGAAAAGALGSEFIQGQVKDAKDNARKEGYQLGRSDAVKQQYWVIQNQQKQSSASTRRVSYLPVTVGGGTNNVGTITVPQTHYVRIEE